MASRRVLMLPLLMLLAGNAGAADPNNQNWAQHGENPAEQRYSTLTQVNTDTVERLGLAWEQSAGSKRGLEATPIVVDGVMYTTGTWSRVMALDAVTGKVLWQYDPKVPRAWAKRLCCDVVNRGVAVQDGKVFLGTLDGRLLALAAGSGEVLWEIDTLVDRDAWYSITGAPRIIKDMVVIGNGGAEYGVRGYITAYDMASGKQRWRFFTVPGSPQGPFENPELAEAVKTWDKDREWTGGGGTAWDSMAYDPELNLLYVGTGNGSPWPRHLRSPGGGDNLFLASILALNPDTGRLAWYYQTTPGDNWDFTATQHMILADLPIDGQPRKVLMQAPKNGFFYVLDRETGELISAEKFVFTNWASHVDLKTGRPVETGLGTYKDEDKYVFPAASGGHNWHPMAFSPETGLVYFSGREAGWVHSKHDDKWFTYGADNLPELIGEQQVPENTGFLKAWDPVTQTLAWQQELPNTWNGGVLATAGNLVLHGTATGDFYALDGKSGKVLKRIEVGTGMIAPPISYAVNGTQYIALMAGWGGPAFNTLEGDEALLRHDNAGRILAFKLDGAAVPLPPEVPPRGPLPAQPDVTADAATLEEGRVLYVRFCGSCHGVYGSEPMLPDLRRMTPATHANFNRIVREGLYENAGMASFADELSESQVESIRAYIVSLANSARAGD
ncbi:MAG: PQQ-dependent dehydrogenase, methanol/ethanol family [Halieaceae bacterium]